MTLRGNRTSDTAAPAAPNETMPATTDSELLQRTTRGDAEALRMLLERHARYLFGVAHALAGDAHDAEDLVQETMLGAMNGRFRGESSFRTWLVAILVNRAAMWRRSRMRRPTQSLDENAVADGATGGVEAKLDLATMLAALSPEQKEVIVLRELEGMSYEQMSAALKIPRGTVESRLHRAREELRRRFRNYL